ncbi:hypothetical protein [Streptomyces sp. WM6378]|uniref:hypothetical protein n=1 Tax=Streptomyces sp. WM6378 TaxID=1415557 RepID=UPI000AA0BD6E|nr:hypothetical protein [Streptomyces sp. WM6378]
MDELGFAHAVGAAVAEGADRLLGGDVDERFPGTRLGIVEDLLAEPTTVASQGRGLARWLPPRIQSPTLLSNLGEV